VVLVSSDPKAKDIQNKIKYKFSSKIQVKLNINFLFSIYI